jgi:hypothetical protein
MENKGIGSRKESSCFVTCCWSYANSQPLETFFFQGQDRELRLPALYRVATNWEVTLETFFQESGPEANLAMIMIGK